MSKQHIFDFLTKLRENNSKEWMDANRTDYHQAKSTWLSEVQRMLDRLSKYDPSLAQLDPKKCIMRINNNNVFHPNKPTYKDNFGFDPYRGKGRVAFYLHLCPGDSFIGGGMYRPDRDQLKAIREAIDYDGQELKKLMAKKDFNDYYNGFSFTEDALKTSPRDYPADHEHLDLLRLKSFVVARSFTDQEVIDEKFIDEVEKAFVLMQPFNAYLHRAITFEE